MVMTPVASSFRSRSFKNARAYIRGATPRNGLNRTCLVLPPSFVLHLHRVPDGVEDECSARSIGDDGGRLLELRDTLLLRPDESDLPDQRVRDRGVIACATHLVTEILERGDGLDVARTGLGHGPIGANGPLHDLVACLQQRDIETTTRKRRVLERRLEHLGRVRDTGPYVSDDREDELVASLLAEDRLRCRAGACFAQGDERWIGHGDGSG